jgi:hypothetical protein
VVCLAALSAMRFGMSVLYARHQEDLQADQQEHSAGPRQPTLHELWGIDTQDDDVCRSHALPERSRMSLRICNADALPCS